MDRGDNARRYQLPDCFGMDIEGLSYVDQCRALVIISDQGKTNQVPHYLTVLPCPTPEFSLNTTPYTIAVLCAYFDSAQ